MDQHHLFIHKRLPVKLVLTRILPAKPLGISEFLCILRPTGRGSCIRLPTRVLAAKNTYYANNGEKDSKKPWDLPVHEQFLRNTASDDAPVSKTQCWMLFECLRDQTRSKHDAQYRAGCLRATSSTDVIVGD